jgi:hypothetical protein
VAGAEALVRQESPLTPRGASNLSQGNAWREEEEEGGGGGRLLVKSLGCVQKVTRLEDRREMLLEVTLEPDADHLRRVRLVRGEGRGVSDWYGVRDAACPLSTRGGGDHRDRRAALGAVDGGVLRERRACFGHSLMSG